MFSAAFDAVTGVLDRRFVLGFCRCSRIPVRPRTARPDPTAAAAASG